MNTFIPSVSMLPQHWTDNLELEYLLFLTLAIENLINLKACMTAPIRAFRVSLPVIGSTTVNYAEVSNRGTVFSEG